MFIILILIASSSLCIYATKELKDDKNNEHSVFNTTTNSIISSLIGLVTLLLISSYVYIYIYQDKNNIEYFKNLNNLIKK